MATLRVIEQENILGEINLKEQLFKDLLKHPKIKSIRSKGLFMALQLGSFKEVKNVIDKSIDKGLLIDWFLFCSDSIRIAPPLVISKEEIHAACTIIVESLD